MGALDRKAAIVAQNVVTGVDFVYVHPNQTTLDVFFLNPPLGLAVSLGDLTAGQVRVHVAEPLLSGAEGPALTIASIAWATNDGRDVLRVSVGAPGGFAPHRLSIADARLDPYFNDVAFSFKANCPSDLDCAPEAPECPPDAQPDAVIDTLARDFWSFRRALFDFASRRHPAWQDRLEADVGVMLAEVMSALGDELAYQQDRIGRELSFASASQRRSVRRHARLVDYEVHDGRGARGWLDVQVASGLGGPFVLTAGTDVWALSDAGRRLPFEVGRGLDEVRAGKTYACDEARNQLTAHLWDEEDTCLPVGATEVWINGHHAGDLPLDDLPPGAPPGRWVVLCTDPTDPALPARRHVVRLIDVADEIDPLGLALGTSTAITRLRWEHDQATPFGLDLETLTVHGNLVPITAGRTEVRQFSLGDSLAANVPRAIERTGANGSPAFLFTLPDPDGEGLVRLPPRGQDDPRAGLPEVALAEATKVGSLFVEGQTWSWRRALIGPTSAEPFDRCFVLDDGTWDRMVGWQRLGGEVVHHDYLAGVGTTVRFGDGEFGRLPAKGNAAPGEERFFQVTYRLGNGAASNVAAGAVSGFDPAVSFWIASVSNPLPVTGGVDPETIDEAKRDAPEAFRAITFRAVRPEDYAEAAERLPWVARAGASFRWTGSWMSAFAAADPRDAVELPPVRRRELERHLDRFRQAGREVFTLAPRYADLDVEIEICVQASSYPGEVEKAVLLVLLGKRTGRPLQGFFDEDNFTFGTPLERASLEAAIQEVPGVKAVERIRLRRRGGFDWRTFGELVYRPAMNEVIRVAADPQHPDRGSLRLFMEGGA